VPDYALTGASMPWPRQRHPRPAGARRV